MTNHLRTKSRGPSPNHQPESPPSPAGYWADINSVRPQSRLNPLCERLGFSNSDVAALYPVSMSEKQELDTALDATGHVRTATADPTTERTRTFLSSMAPIRADTKERQLVLF